MSDITCTVCGTDLDLAALFAHADDQRALARLVAVSVPLGARVLLYVSLFKPEKQNLTAAKKIKLILQLLPDLERKAIAYKGRDWDAPLAAWAQAIDGMIDARNAGRLELPMKNHNYLYSTLSRMAHGVESVAEAKREEDRRNGPRPATTNGPAAVGDLVGAAPAAAPAAPRTAPQKSPGMSPTVRAMHQALAKNRPQSEEQA